MPSSIIELTTSSQFLPTTFSVSSVGSVAANV